MTMTHIHADGRREDWIDQPMQMHNHAARIDTSRVSSDSEWLAEHPAPAEACTDLGSETYKHEASWRWADAAAVSVALVCVLLYVAGVIA